MNSDGTDNTEPNQGTNENGEQTNDTTENQPQTQENGTTQVQNEDNQRKSEETKKRKNKISASNHPHITLSNHPSSLIAKSVLTKGGLNDILKQSNAQKKNNSEMFNNPMNEVIINDNYLDPLNPKKSTLKLLFSLFKRIPSCANITSIGFRKTTILSIRLL